MWYKIWEDNGEFGYEKAKKTASFEHPEGGVEVNMFFIGNKEVWYRCVDEFSEDVYNSAIRWVYKMYAEPIHGMWYVLYDQAGMLPFKFIKEDPPDDAYIMGRWAVKGKKVWYKVRKDPAKELVFAWCPSGVTVFNPETGKLENHVLDVDLSLAPETPPAKDTFENNFFKMLFADNMTILGKAKARHPFIGWFRTISYNCGFPAAVLYGYLLRRCWKKGGKVKFYYITTSHKELEKETGLSSKQLTKAKRKLKEHGYLEIGKKNKNGIRLKLLKVPKERPNWLPFYPMFIKILGVKAGIYLLGMINEYEIRNVRASNWLIMRKYGLKRMYISQVKKKLREEYNLDVKKNSLVLENVLSCLLLGKPLVEADDPRNDVLRTWFLFSPSFVGNDIIVAYKEVLNALKNWGERTYFMKYYQKIDKDMKKMKNLVKLKDDYEVEPKIAVKSGVFEGIILNHYLKRHGIELVTNTIIKGDEIYAKKQVLMPDRLFRKLLYDYKSKYIFKDYRVVWLDFKIECPVCKYERTVDFQHTVFLDFYARAHQKKLFTINCDRCGSTLKVVFPRYLILGKNRDVPGALNSIPKV